MNTRLSSALDTIELCLGYGTKPMFSKLQQFVVKITCSEGLSFGYCSEEQLQASIFSL